MGARWTEDEKRLGIECKTIEELFLRYSKEIGDTTLSRVKSIWSHRQLLVAAKTAQEKSKESQSKIPERIAFPDEAETLSHISNKLSELIEVQKESLVIQREMYSQVQGMNSQLTGMNVMFQRLSRSKDEEK